MGHSSLTASTDKTSNMKFLVVLSTLAVMCAARPQFVFLVPGNGAGGAASSVNQEQLLAIQRSLGPILQQLQSGQFQTQGAVAPAAEPAAPAAAPAEVAAPEVAAAEVAAAPVEAPVAEEAPVVAAEAPVV